MSNTTQRILVSVIAIPFIIAACYFGNELFLLFASGIGFLSFYEFSKMVKNKGIITNLYFGSVSVILLVINSYYVFIDFQILIILIILILFFFELFRNKESAILNLGTTLTGIFYIGLFSSSLVLIREYFNYSGFLYHQGGYLIISLLFTIWICDSAAFFIGTAFGKHKIFPRISPKKSVEGSVAGLVFSIITMLAAKSFFIEFLSWTDTIIIGLIVGTAGQAGDFIESMIKRDAGVKDSSSLIPGHGGIFDRFDSLLFSAPVIYLYLHYFI